MLKLISLYQIIFFGSSYFNFTCFFCSTRGKWKYCHNESYDLTNMAAYSTPSSRRRILLGKTSLTGWPFDIIIKEPSTCIPDSFPDCREIYQGIARHTSGIAFDSATNFCVDDRGVFSAGGAETIAVLSEPNQTLASHYVSDPTRSPHGLCGSHKLHYFRWFVGISQPKCPVDSMEEETMCPLPGPSWINICRRLSDGTFQSDRLHQSDWMDYTKAVMLTDVVTIGTPANISISDSSTGDRSLCPPKW